MRSACCLCVRERPYLDFRMPGPIFIKLGMHLDGVVPKSLPFVYTSACVSPYHCQETAR
jgi:hypothetical protein